MPVLSMMPTCRRSDRSSSASSAERVSVALDPPASNRSPLGPNDPFAKACVAIVPVSAAAEGTTAPMARNFDWLATPRAPVRSSRASTEKVIAHRPFYNSPSPSSGVRTTNHVPDSCHVVSCESPAAECRFARVCAIRANPGAIDAEAVLSRTAPSCAAGPPIRMVTPTPWPGRALGP
ncbi:MAG: hypothetical protein JWN00_4341 [Actinomycetia bacterium]|nr:hypothetical protein [Actinomycetes bacterium]